jgi:hypothetical protein
MGKKDARIDAYIRDAASFANPLLKRLRRIVHKGCPGVEETIKWGMPFFEYHGTLCFMAAFKQHAAFGFRRGDGLEDPKCILKKPASKGGDAMGHLGRITSVKDLPTENDLLPIIRQAAVLNEDIAALKNKNKVRVKK